MTPNTSLTRVILTSMPLVNSLPHRKRPLSTPHRRSVSNTLLAASLLHSFVVSAFAASPALTSLPESKAATVSVVSDTVIPGFAGPEIDSFERRKSVTFRYPDERQNPAAPGPLHSDGLDRQGPASSAILRYDNVPSPELDAALNVDSGAQSGALPPPLLRSHPHDSPSPNVRLAAYNDDLIGRQTGSGYVFVRRTDAPTYISGAGAALVTLFSRRDSPVSRPPLVPNSNSRLLIGLVIVCILAVGILTLAAQEIYRRLQTLGRPRSPLRRRSGESRPARTLFRSDSSYASSPANGLAAPSLEEEEERIKTPPTLSRRSSAIASSLALSPLNENCPNPKEDEPERKSQNHDLHYFSLPFGIGIGYTYANISDGGDARSRISRLAAKRSRNRSGSTLALSTGALPVPGSSSAVSGGDGLRSRSRSFRELCRDAFGGAMTRDTDIIAEDDGGSDMKTISGPRWGSSLVSLDLPSSERSSGTVTPTGTTSATALSMSTSGIALEDLASASQSAKGRSVGLDNGSASGHTLIDLGLGPPELAISDPDGITRPASTPGVMPSQVARHPQVEQLRRQGRGETSKRVGKGTPTNAKLF